MLGIKKAFTVLSVSFAIVIAGLFFMYQQDEGEPVVDQGVQFVSYDNEKYGFHIEYPKDWKITVHDSGYEPYINIYPGSVKMKPPFTHHADVPNVSIFPHGVATEGIRGKTASSSISFNVSVEKPFDYLLENGDRWATFSAFASPPQSWESYGFIWARASVPNRIQSCLHNGVEVETARCFELGELDLELVDRGDVSEEERELEERILESFRFI